VAFTIGMPVGLIRKKAVQKEKRHYQPEKQSSLIIEILDKCGQRH